MHIAVAGNIGSGKTTLTTLLAQHFNWLTEFEAVDHNPYLEDFYKDMERWSFHLQVYFLNSRFQQLTNIAKNSLPTIQDRTIFEDSAIFATNLHQSGLLSERDYQTYTALYRSLLQYAKAPDLLIYLRADLPKLLYQIKKRGRLFEQSISPDYLENLNHLYENWISNYSMGKLLIIDVNKMDFENKSEDFARIAELVEIELRQK